jgi:hypothetical protein
VQPNSHIGLTGKHACSQLLSRTVPKRPHDYVRVPPSPHLSRRCRAADKKGFDSDHWLASDRNTDLAPELGRQVKTTNRGQWR